MTTPEARELLAAAAESEDLLGVADWLRYEEDGTDEFATVRLSVAVRAISAALSRSQPVLGLVEALEEIGQAKTWHADTLRARARGALATFRSAQGEG